MLDTDTPEDYREALALAGMGTPGGPAVTVLLGPAEQQPGGLETPGHLAQAPAQPLRATTAGDALRALATLYPERVGSPGMGVLLRDLRGVQGPPLAESDPLQEGELLHLRLNPQ